MLLEELTTDAMFHGEHMTQMDVTGGIGLKVARGFTVAEVGIDVVLVSGEIPGRVRDACLGKPVRGTRLQA